MNRKKKPVKNGTTYNVAVDMVYAAVKHYAKLNKKVTIANLSARYWQIFARFMEEQPGSEKVEIRPEGVQFNNLLVRQGTKFQIQHLVCEFAVPKLMATA